jgi:hypothetical protein
MLDTRSADGIRAHALTSLGKLGGGVESNDGEYTDACGHFQKKLG